MNPRHFVFRRIEAAQRLQSCGRVRCGVLVVDSSRHSSLSVFRDSKLGGATCRSLILIAGFPVALVFSWAFEITPEGIKRESEIPHESVKSVTHHTGRKIVVLTIVLAVVAVGLMALSTFGDPKTSTLSKITGKNVPTENPAAPVLDP